MNTGHQLKSKLGGRVFQVGGGGGGVNKFSAGEGGCPPHPPSRENPGVTSESTQSSSKCVSSFKDSSVLLNIRVVNFTKLKSSNHQHNGCGKSQKYISEHKQNVQNNEDRAQPLNSIWKLYSSP